MLPVYIFFGLLALSAVGLWTVGTYFGFWGKSIEKPLCDRVNYTIKCNTLGEQKEVHTEPW